MNGDNKLTGPDFINFAQHYYKPCTGEYTLGGCGGLDVNNDKYIGPVDFINFAQKYYPATNKSCN